MTVLRFPQVYDSQDGKMPQKQQKSEFGSSSVSAVPPHLQLG